jgi:sec-independent protein translocase protein TatB
MFDIGASEIFLTALIALVVLGPQRLPAAARFAGLWIRRARAQWASVRAELERELEADRLRADLDAARAAAPMQDMQAAMREIDDAVASAARAAVAASNPADPP